MNKTIAQIFEARYVIPLYQRNFAWREEQIAQLLQDVYQAYKTNPNGNYFIGSLVVKKQHEEEFEVIDGQQRLTVLSLIMKLLGMNAANKLFYDSRPYVAEFLEAFYAERDFSALNHPTVASLKKAVDIIKGTNLAEERDTDEAVYFYDRDGKPDADFAQYFAQHVILVRVEVPEDTDVSAYFEIMNNRGEQLQEHEILKALFIGEIKDEKDQYDLGKQQAFSVIWDACSQMDYHIEKVLKKEQSVLYLGENFDEFRFEELPTMSEKQTATALTINKILNPTNPAETADDEAGGGQQNNNEDAKYAAIIDFPNFLMHIFKAFYEKEYGKPVPLDAKYMLEVFEQLNQKKMVKPEIFIGQLFRMRVFFDRYIVKTMVAKNEDNEDEDENFAWSLIRPDNKEGDMVFVNTFGDGLAQQRVVKALTMLQVSFRSRKYKNWLQTALRWFADQPKASLCIDAEAYWKMLDKFALDRFDAICQQQYSQIGEAEVLTRENSMSDGVGTPHFLFNFIDYLYWAEHATGGQHGVFDNEAHEGFRLKDFDFKYWNSVEHHLSRQKAENLEHSENYIDNLGNLCLISRGANSRLNDRDVKEKVMTYATSNMGSNRQIIYSLTEDNNYEWKEENIKAHYNALLELLGKRCEILGCSKSSSKGGAEENTGKSD